MHFANMYPYLVKNQEKCSKIFRPWDNVTQIQTNNHQDSTISTTTTENDELDVSKVSEKSVETTKHFEEIKTTPKTKVGFRPVVVKNTTTTSENSNSKCNNNNNEAINQYNMSNNSFPQIPDCVLNVDYGMYPEVLHANLANSLGLTQNDPLFLETLAQGYALEEYARVLSQEQQAKILNSKKQRPKKYKCPHCDVGFSNNGQLKGHIRIHTGERPFKCDEKVCGKTFTRNEELTRHKRIHSGLRPYPCTQCGKRFGRKDHLKKHSRTHFQPRGMYAVPVMLPYDTWAASTAATYPYMPSAMFGY